ncbi:hypothetical protein FRC02_003798, partial [Tulasnella sp. 418]
VVKTISTISTYFHKSTKAAAELRDIQIKLYGKTRALETIGKTRFGTFYWSARSIQRSWQSLEQFGASPDLEERYKSTKKVGKL